MKTVKMILSALLILAGSFLEILYIYYRYKADGIFLPICIVIGIGLNIFLMLAVYEKKNGLAIALIFFSILNTTSGQTLSMLKKENTEKKTNSNDVINSQIMRYQNSIDEMENEIKAINKRLNGFETMEEKAMYRNNVRDDEASIQKKRDEIKAAEEKITELSSKQKTAVEQNVDQTSVYSFYGSIPEWKLKDWITFILHTILSFFISIMAPFGIRVLEKETRKEVAKEEKEFTVEDWASWVWRLNDRLNKQAIPSEYALQEYAHIAGKKWNPEKHKTLLEKAKKVGIIDIHGKPYGNAENAEKMLKNEK